MWLRLDGEGALHAQTTRALREAIRGGRLAPGARLPSSRALARELGVSRNTVLQAFEQLEAEGSLRARRGSGTYVAPEIPAAPAHPPRPAGRAGPSPPRLSSRARRALAAMGGAPLAWGLPRRPLPCDFRYGEPAFADLPHTTWCRMLARRARRASVRRLAYGPPGGAPELREALAGYLRRARGVRCTPEQVIVVRGTQQAIDLCVRALLDPGDAAVLEDPHYTGFSLALAAHGARRRHVPVDGDGLRVDALPEEGARLVCVTPSHQFPSGGVLPLPRRLALLAWAERHGAAIFEDDYDGEYRYDVRPVESLQSLDEGGRVLYAGTASKLLFPALRIGWLVVPEPLREALLAEQVVADTGTAGVEQLALADFVAGGHLERHVRRSRARNARRRAALLSALDRRLGGRARIEGASAGLHVVVWLPELPASRSQELRRRALHAGVRIHPVEPYYARPPERCGFLLGYAALEEADIEDGVRRLAQSLP